MIPETEQRLKEIAASSCGEWNQESPLHRNALHEVKLAYSLGRADALKQFEQIIAIDIAQWGTYSLQRDVLQRLAAEIRALRESTEGKGV